MDAVTASGWGMWGLALAILAHAILWFFKSPKEATNDLERRLNRVELSHQALELRVEGTYARHDKALENLTKAVEGLAAKFERYTESRGGR